MSVIATSEGIHIIAVSASDALQQLATEVEVQTANFTNAVREKDYCIRVLKHDLEIAQQELAKLKGETK